MASLSLPPRLLAGRLLNRYLAVLCGVVLSLAGAAILAQVAGDRGIAPVATSTDIEVRDIAINVTGDNPEDARARGWREAQRIAWQRVGGPELPDSRLESLVSAIVVEEENIGPRRYIARLGVIFDRQRAGELLGGRGERARSAPMLLLPVTVSGGTQTIFEYRNPWQRAWAEYQFGASSIDYVRPTGSGGESLLLTYGQTNRRSRAWWNTILDQFGAADVLVPIANIRHEWPGGPIEGRFTARYGPDHRFLAEFTMQAQTDAELPEMLDRAVAQFDRIFTNALRAGTLTPDPTLSLDNIEISDEIRAFLETAQAAEALEQARAEAASAEPLPGDSPAAPVAPAEPQQAPVSIYTVQVGTPDAASFDAALGGLRSVPGVGAASVTSTAIGGTSVLRVSFAGDLPALAAALRERGWQVVEGNGALAISR
jgi:hypothetical protein